MTITPFLIFSAVFTLLGFLFPYFKTINGFIGYRTARSMKNQRNWDFAQKYSGKWFICIGLGSIPFIIIHYLKLVNERLLTASFFFLLTLVVILLFYKTEKHLKELDKEE